VCPPTVASEFAIKLFDILASGVETIPISRELAEEVRRGRQDRHVVGVADRPLGEGSAVLLAGDMISLLERLAGEAVVTGVDEAGFECDQAERVNRTLVFAAVESARAEREDALSGGGVLPGRVDLGDDVLTVAEASNG
jgi:hypothetical protein